jgi:hypothetical protein
LSYRPYPALTLALAREAHEKARALKRQGIDPAAEKQARKHAEEESERTSSMLTFAALTKEWMETWSRHDPVFFVFPLPSAAHIFYRVRLADKPGANINSGPCGVFEQGHHDVVGV